MSKEYEAGELFRIVVSVLERGRAAERHARRVQVEYGVAPPLVLADTPPERLDVADFVPSDLDPILALSLVALLDPDAPHRLDDSARLPHAETDAQALALPASPQQDALVQPSFEEVIGFRGGDEGSKDGVGGGVGRGEFGRAGEGSA